MTEFQATSRAEAYELGLTHYFTGKPCKHGHVAPRFVKGSCFECCKVEAKSERFIERQRHYRNQPKNKLRKKELLLKGTYGISLAEYDDLLIAQDFICPICRKKITENGKGNDSFAVDHCHLTGKVRGVLCGACNRGLGLFGDNADLLMRAAEYLKAHANG
jgi:Autographiviridae endonuclease VII